MSQIDWSSFSWEAFATIIAGILSLIAGGAAVLGAILIGTRQAEILREQSSIQARLSNIEELKLRSELFEDRFKVYIAVRKWIQFHISHAAGPGDRRSEIEPGEGKVRSDYFAALDRARFLFRPSVYDNLNRLHRAAQDVTFTSIMMEEPSEQANHQDHVQTKWAAMRELSAAWEDLGSVFGDELNLSIHGSVHGDLPEQTAARAD